MNKYKLILLIIFAIILVWSGIHPISPAYWLLENSPIFFALLVFIIFDRYFKLSNFSYTLIAIYIIFPLATSHYGVTGVPFGHTLGELLGTTRNMYDRLTHFSFGFFSFYPIYEFVLSINKEDTARSYIVSLETILAFSAIYEIFEWIAAVTVNPILAASFYGSQGDIFDTQKDMGIAALGAIFAMCIVFLLRRYRKII